MKSDIFLVLTGRGWEMYMQITIIDHILLNSNT